MGKTAKKYPKLPLSQQTGENHMVTFFEAKTKHQNYELKVEENMNTGYNFQELRLTFQDLKASQRLALKKVAKTYEAKTKETNQELTLTLATEPQDTTEEWIKTIMEELTQQEIKETLALGTTYKIEETDETLTTLQIVTAQDLHGTDFNRKQELTQRDEPASNLGLAFEDYLRINEKLARDQTEVKINEQLTNTKETIRLHYPRSTGYNEELIALIEREYKKTTQTEVTITNKPNNSGAIGHYYKTKQAIIEIATFEDILRKTSTEFDYLLESMELYSTPDFQAFYEMNWANFPIITRERNRTAQDFVTLAKEAIRETLDYTSTWSTYNQEITITNTTIDYTYTDKMNPNSYIFIIVRAYKQ